MAEVQPDLPEKYSGLVERYNDSCKLVDDAFIEQEKAREDANTTEEQRDKLLADYSAAVHLRDGLWNEMQEKSRLEEARKQHRPISFGG